MKTHYELFSGSIVIFILIFGNNFAEGESQIPSWTKNLSVWWTEGKISDETFFEAMNFLINSGIVKIDSLQIKEFEEKSILPTSERESNNKIPGFNSNEEFIEGLYKEIDLTDEIDVFRYVFFNLNENVTVYPTENYYYFQFPASGKTIWGTLTLSTQNRDQGFLGFNYVASTKKVNQEISDLVASGKFLNKDDGVFVNKINDFKYSVSFEGKTVVFNLNEIGLDPPTKANLMDDEVYVGTSFDESGLKFFLLFNDSVKKLYWILNEDGFVPETFSELTFDIVIGDRTEFAFYLDKINDRKILIGVEGRNVIVNNWYDGPFDHLPDNYIHLDRINIKKYLEFENPDLNGKIDKYGRFLEQKGSRVAVSPYHVYFDKFELLFVNSCKIDPISASEFYSCITQPYFKIPEKFFNN